MEDMEEKCPKNNGRHFFIVEANERYCKSCGFVLGYTKNKTHNTFTGKYSGNQGQI